MKSYEYIQKQAQKKINHYLTAGTCKHVWVLHAAGYKCKKCGYYTGTNNILNDMIKKEKASVK